MFWHIFFMREVALMLLVCAGLLTLVSAPIIFADPCSTKIARAYAAWMNDPSPQTEQALAQTKHEVRRQANIMRVLWAVTFVGIVCGIYRLRKPGPGTHKEASLKNAGHRVDLP